MTITNGYTTLARAQQHILNQMNYTAATISFTGSTKTIADTAYGLDAFQVGDRIQISGSTINDGFYTLATAGAASFTVTTAIGGDEVAGDTVTIRVVKHTFEDWLLEDAIEAASRAIDARTGRTWYGATATRYYVVGEDTDGRTLTLDRPLLSVTTLTNGNDEVLTATTHYILLPLNETAKRQIVLTTSGLKTWSYTSDPLTDIISVAGSWGDAASAPPDIEKACLILAARLYKRKDVVFGKEGINALGTQTLSLPKDPDVEALLAPYKRML